jgi:OHCU decarboxylase
MNEQIKELNEAGLETAESMFRDCCGSTHWAKLMTESRPFASGDELLLRAAAIWQSLDAVDWLEAFASHPKIGERKAAADQQKRSAEWSKGEQSAAANAAGKIREELAEANRLYEQKFGFIFIVCATGKSADEMLEICRGRLSNTRDDEIRIAAEEQRKITELRLKKLLHQ